MESYLIVTIVGSGLKSKLMFTKLNFVGKMTLLQKVLIASEQKQLVKFLGSTLSQLGDHFIIIVVASGLEALKLLRSQSIDLLLTDYILADMTGLQLLQAVHTGASRPGFTIFVSPDDLYGRTLFLNNHSIIGMYLTFPDDENKAVPLLRQAVTNSLKQATNHSLPKPNLI